jgi:hypothetical protein
MRVIFRAQFQGPKGLLNPAGFPMPRVVVQVEIFRKADSWFARAPEQGTAFARLGSSPTHGCMKDMITEHFDKQVSKWTLHDTDGNPLDPDSVTEDPNGNFEKKELTHVGRIGAPPSKMGPNYFTTVCGIDVHVRQIRSARSHTPPDCKQCRPEWAKLKDEDRLK